MGRIQTKYTANTGCVTISTGNSNLDGSGDISTVLTAGQNGTFIKSVIIKAQDSTSLGMIRLFLYNGSGNAKLVREIDVQPIVTQSSRDETFFRYLPMRFNLEAGDQLLVSTENSEVFNIIAEGYDWEYSDSYTELSIQYTANTGIEEINTANNNRDGSGTCPTILTSAASPFLGCEIQQIIVKAMGSVTPGMIRLYIFDGSEAFLFCEVPIPYATIAPTAQSFIARASIPIFSIQNSFSILASTENGEKFSVIAEGRDWKYLQ
ncbi:MAG: hypothetical protein LC109_08535 [Bacteroidia bacterium]|nr:hypothetical protein [Bacteroidia bacterium]